jgi:DEAD/DEAH box helicase domain-containing protein
MYDRIFIDIETKYTDAEVGGWYPDKMGLAVAVTYDSFNGYRCWREEDANELISRLNMYEAVIGYNLIDFDYEVLKAYNCRIKQLLNIKTVDILQNIKSILGFRIKLDDLAKMTLGKQKEGNGLGSVYWWKKGDYRKVEEYCKQDVCLTKELFDYGRKYGLIYYSKNGIKQKLNINWR